MSANPTDEESLLERVRRRDEQAIARIHNDHYPEIYRYAFYRTGRTAVADDIASEVFVRLIDALRGNHPPQKNLRGWLFGVAANLVADYFRAEYRETGISQDGLADPVSTAAEAEYNIQWEALVSVMRKLSAEQQTVLALRFGDGFSVEETAKIMGKSVSGVKVLQFRALKALRQLLGISKEKRWTRR